MNELLSVYGFPRSGNNLFCLLLYKNFYEGYVDCSRQENVYQMAHWSRRDEAKLFVLNGEQVKTESFIIPYVKLFAGHSIDLSFPYDRGIYILRDFEGVAKSVYRWKETRRKDQEQLTFEEYLKTPLDWEYGFGKKGKLGLTLRQMWEKHIYRYLSLMPFVVTYATLTDRKACELAMRRIASHFNLEFVKDKIVSHVPYTGHNARLEDEE